MVRTTLVTDGTSDVVLVPVLEWLMRQVTPEEFETQWADPRAFPERTHTLAEKLVAAVREYPCQLLFVHRDAERQPPQARYEEIGASIPTGCPHVCVVPVRMQEAWLLHDEGALREAAGRPSGKEDLDLPPDGWDRLADPKRTLHQALRAANGAKGRRRSRRFKPAVAAHRLANLITDWSPLRTLAAFAQLERDTRTALEELGLPVAATT